MPHYYIAADAAGEEHRRLESALTHGAEDLARLQERVRAELGGAEAGIFDAHLMFLNDRQFHDRICEFIDREKVNAEWAVEATVQHIAAALASGDNEYLREREADIRDLGRRVLRHLSADERRPLAYLPAGSILVARELYPFDLLDVDRAHLAGIVTEFGGQTDHAAILARSLAIPAITGVADATRQLPPGIGLLVDGGSGTVTVSPSEKEAERFGVRIGSYNQRLSQATSEEGLKAQTVDGLVIDMLANIGRAVEAKDVALHRLDGVGLYRTEYLFLNDAEAPTYEKHRAAYEFAPQQLRDKPLVIRTLDLGGDKFPQFLAHKREQNPMLGLRGLRFLLIAGRSLFETQVRAILSVAATYPQVRVLLPMVLGPSDFAAALSIIKELAVREGLAEIPKVGAMIETPAAVLTIDGILELADFVSIGTNDLTQFVLAADRNALDIVEYHTVLHAAVLRAIKVVSDASMKAGKAVSVCGEAAADPALASLLVGLGIRQLSMSPAASARVRQRIRAFDSRDAKALAVWALDCNDTYLVRKTIYSWQPSAGPMELISNIDANPGGS